MKSAFLNWLRRYDFSFFGISTCILIVGVLNLYSATHLDKTSLYQTQIVWFIISLFVGLLVSFIRSKQLFWLSYPAYIIGVLMLVLVDILGHIGMGAQRWLDLGIIKFQPSELVKVAVVLVLARWFARNSPESEVGFKELIIPGILVFIPVILIVLQPDLGTGILVCLIFGSIAFYRRLKWKTIGILAILGIIFGAFSYNFVLKPYQQKRIINFLNPDHDAKGSGYNAIQSKIAIGSGQFFGKGFEKSSQASLNYLPENHTDFVFAVYNEEHGFFGSLVLIALYIFLFYRYIWLATATTSFFNAIVVIGLMSIIFWHTFINMAMVTGLMPIVGIPLPFMSYGGTSLLTFGICNGIATSISNSRNIF